MKKIIISIVMILVVILPIYGCGASTKGKYAGEKTIGGFAVLNDDLSTIEESTGIGIRYTEPLKGLIDNQYLMEAMAPPYAIQLMTISKKIQDNEIKKLEDNLTREQQEKIYQSIKKNTVYFIGIVRIERSDPDSREVYQEFMKSYEHRKEIGKIDKNTYYFGYNDNFEQYELTSTERNRLQNAVKEIPEFQQHIYIFKPKNQYPGGTQ